jgi:hypothetical protein
LGYSSLCILLGWCYGHPFSDCALLVHRTHYLEQFTPEVFWKSTTMCCFGHNGVPASCHPGTATPGTALHCIALHVQWAIHLLQLAFSSHITFTSRFFPATY